MADYGLTNDGPNIKRLDVILDEMHTDLSERWGVNTRQNTESFINHLLTNVADQIAELWEFGENVYYSQYPSSADGISLDNAAQIAGAFRKNAEPSVYPLHCTGVDGATLDTTTMVASVTNPVTQLTLVAESKLTRASVNQVRIKIPGDEAITADTYRVTIDGADYTVVSNKTERVQVLGDISSVLSASLPDFTFSVNADDVTLDVAANEITRSFALSMSDNLTTETVTCILNFQTTENGDIFLPNETITAIVKAPAEFIKVTNLCEYIPGRLVETDAEFRNSYFDTLFSGSSTMSESIRSSILANVQGVTSVTVFENDTDTVDANGLYPHSIEVVVVCTENQQIYQKIAEQIFLNKAAGINTYGSVSKTVTGDGGESITIRFSVPEPVYVWWRLEVTPEITDVDVQNEIKAIIAEYVDSLSSGENVVPQRIFGDIFTKYPSITYIDVKLAVTETSEAPDPSDYTETSVLISNRNVAVTTVGMVSYV